KAEWIGEITSIMMHQIRTHDYDGTGRHDVRSELVVFERTAAHDPRRWIQTQRLRDHHFGISQMLEILDSRKPAGKLEIEFMMKSFFDLRMFGQQIPGPRKRVRSGFVTGEKNGDRFVSQLKIRHLTAVAFFVLSRKKHGQ